MDRNSALASGGSLIERAARVYDFGAAMRARGHTSPSGKSISNVEQELDLGSFDTNERRQGVIDRTSLAAGGFILPDMPAGPLAEEFRIVKRQLLGRDAEGGRIILVCSARPDDGKTFCAVNLALSMASEKDIEVLLVDADFLKPEIVSTLGLEAGPGLIDVIADAALDPEQWLIRTDVPGLSVLPAGRHSHDATELLASDRTRAVLARLAAMPNRVIIIDSAPLLASSSASVLADHAGQALLIVRADRTSEPDLREAVALIDRCEHVRLLLNGVEFGASERRFGGYYGISG